jgi:hypothetical protein
VTSKHVFVDISSHGFGHLAQTAPVLDALAHAFPNLRLSIRSGLPPGTLRKRIDAPFEFIAGRSDFCFVMIDAVRIDRAATGKAYRAWHADWERRVTDEAAFLRTLAPDLALTNVAYLPLAAAARAGIPALSMCSLNWADLFAHVFGDEAWAGTIHQEILAAYRAAQCFLRLTPAMPMPDLPDTRVVAPVAATGRVCREALREKIGALQNERIVLLAFGGFDADWRAADWPLAAGLHYLVPENWECTRSDMTVFESLRMNFIDLLCSVDAVLTKPGYGTFTEAACNGVPVLYVRRDNWPEQDCLIEWLEKNARCRELSSATLVRGDLRSDLESLWRQPRVGMPRAGGAEELARLIAAYLL